jgi:ABC-type Fe3+-hydroxamate transport system substrate-binding protein
LAGGRNACTATGFPVVSVEGILQMNPEVIVDLVFPDRPAGQRPETIAREWRQLPEVDAVRNDRVYVVEDDFALIPGPRFILLAEKLARLFHPEKASPR